MWGEESATHQSSWFMAQLSKTNLADASLNISVKLTRFSIITIALQANAPRMSRGFCHSSKSPLNKEAIIKRGIYFSVQFTSETGIDKTMHHGLQAMLFVV